MVHHMLLYRCPSFVTQPYNSQCYQHNLGDYCIGVVATWGVGGGVRDTQVSTSESFDSFRCLFIFHVSFVLVYADAAVYPLKP